MQPEFVQCHHCRIGTLRRGIATYAQWVGDDLVMVPNVSAWQCDVCGDFAYEDDLLTRVELLLGSQMETPRSPRVRQSHTEPGSLPAADDSKQRSAK